MKVMIEDPRIIEICEGVLNIVENVLSLNVNSFTLLSLLTIHLKFESNSRNFHRNFQKFSRASYSLQIKRYCEPYQRWNPERKYPVAEYDNDRD